ncbi:MAG: hypothetical protein A2536_09380 [Candidatus Firestonebacteria bacterium RIFOXYD2_FULL_39_29]|nr:MAG: hypothetical protein A2536_09380 [Candidatus Firestonebacteria bacterium RIFOXYD2_FULL_39_29]
MRLILSLFAVLCACAAMAHAADLTGLLLGQVDSAAQPLGKGEKIIGVASIVGLIIALVYYIFFKKDDKK